ncbi:MAG: branched-chain amino acid aminotransferase, partial [bacterium]
MAFVPIDDRDGWIWFDGEFVPWREARVHVLTHALHYASSVFEGERMYNGQIFKLTEHTNRFFRSAEVLDFRIPFTVAQINDACKETCARNGLTDAYVRPLAWRGSEQVSVPAQNTTVHVAIAAWDWPSYFDPETKRKGIRLCWAPYKRPSPETAPTEAKAAGLYMIGTINRHYADARGYADAMLLDWRGYVAEATGANVFFVQDGRVITPPADGAILNGITRQTVLEMLAARGVEVEVRAILP